MSTIPVNRDQKLTDEDQPRSTNDSKNITSKISEENGDQDSKLSDKEKPTLINDDKTTRSEIPEEKEKNFTWEHFFCVHCGILPQDALAYEKQLIAHRLDPLNTLLESLNILVERALIPVGDKIKIEKALKNKEHILNIGREEMKKAKEQFGLEKYSDVAAKVILDIGGGVEDEDIQYGIELWEDGMRELEKSVSIHIIKDGANDYAKGLEIGKMMNNPARILLTEGFGYSSFDYTKDKDTGINNLTTETLFNLDSLGVSDERERKSPESLMYS